MNMEFLNDLVEYMSLKREVGNPCLHSLEDRFVPAAYAIHRIVSKSLRTVRIGLNISYTTHSPGFLSLGRRKEACFD